MVLGVGGFAPDVVLEGAKMKKKWNRIFLEKQVGFISKKKGRTNMPTLVYILMIVVLIFALVYTIVIGKSQQSSSNTQYDRNRKRNLILLTLIYVISVGAAVILLYDYVKNP